MVATGTGVGRRGLRIAAASIAKGVVSSNMKEKAIVRLESTHPRGSRVVSLAAGAVILLLAAAGCVASPASTPDAAPPAMGATIVPPVPAPGDTPATTVDATAQNRWQSTSPDGQWIAEGSMEGPFLEGDQEKYHARLTVRSRDGQAIWPVIDQVANYGLGYTIPTPLHWSADGRTLYVTNQPVPDGCALFVNGTDLLRVDLTTGTVTELVPPVGSSLALSPDETQLAYIGWGVETELVVQPLHVGDATHVPLATGPDTVQAGNITWSPGGTSVLVTLAFNPCQEESWSQSIVRIDLAPVRQNILVDRDARRLDTVSWTEPSRAWLRDAAGNDWWLDVTTGEVTSVP